MSSARTFSAGGRALRTLSAVLALPLLALAVVAGPAQAAPPPPKPTSLTVVASTDPAIAAQLTGVPGEALPGVLAAVGTPFQIEVSLWDGDEAAAFARRTAVALTATGPGALSVSEVVIPAGETSVTLLASYSAPAAAVRVGAAIPSAELSAQSAAFPVDVTLALLDGQSASLREGTAGADGSGCSVVDAARPVCGVVALPNGAQGTVALSLGVCPSAGACLPGALVTQLIADLGTGDAGLYTRTAPAQMTLICDKTLCGKGGVTRYRAQWSQSATGDLVAAPPCPAKGVIGADQEFCTDVVTSTRDNAGDLHLVVLFLHDVRGTI